MATVKEILDEFCDRINQPRESSYVGATTPAARQYVSLFKSVAAQLLDNPNGWTQLKKTFYLQSYQGVSRYQLPADFLRGLVGASWNATSQIPLSGPLTNARLAFQTYGVNIATPYAGFQINGAQGYQVATTGNSSFTRTSAGSFEFSPPGQDNITESVFAYTSANYTIPASWVASTAYTTPKFISSQAQTWILITNGTSGTGQFPEFGRDNNIIWKPILTYIISELYFAGQYVFTGSKVYKVTTGGKSSAGTPSVTSGSETLGTVVFEYIATPGAWVAGTTYEAGDYVYSTSNSIAYYCVQGGVSGLLSPKFYYTLESTNFAPPLFSKRVLDGTAVWASYDEVTGLVADTDLVILDSDLFIEGMRYAWYESKQQFQMADRIKMKWDSDVRSAVGRQNGASVINAGTDVNSVDQWPVTAQQGWGPLPS